MKKTIPIGEGVADLFGTYDGNIKYLESLLQVEVQIVENNLTVEGTDRQVTLVEQLLGDSCLSGCFSKLPRVLQSTAARPQDVVSS